MRGFHYSQYPFLSIFVQNCSNVYNMICDYFNFFLHFSIAYIKSFQDMYHKFHLYCTYILRKCKNIGYFTVLLEKSDFYYWPMLEKRSKISLVHICAPKPNLLWIIWVQPICQSLKIKCSLLHSKCRAKNVHKIWLL